MQTPLALEMLAPRADAGAQAPTLRLPAAAWAALLSALEVHTRTTSLPGTATVVARAPGGTYRIDYGGRLAGFTWPQPLSVGSTLHLARTPAAALPVAALPLAPVDSTPLGESVPAAARLLEGALRDAPAPLALRLQTPPPALSNAPALPQQLAGALAKAVSGSGVFFESHLAEWVRGARDTAPVLAEAQARAATLAAAPEAAGEPALRQQLASLVTGELTFQFAAWPGQDATLAIGGEPEPAAQAAAPERAFHAHLEMELPVLGPVHAMLSLNARGIDIDVRGAAAAVDALRAGRDSLAQALAAADLRVGRIEVGHERG
ncbi:MAG: flagellar hook-length control protein FliK [Burkholderiales bacterium]